MKYFWSSQQNSQKPKPTFKQKYSLQQRIKNRQKLELKYPKGQFVYAVLQGFDKVTTREKSFMLIGIEKGLTVLYLLQYLRKSLNISEKKGIFIQVGNKITDMTQTVGSLYEKMAQQDGFMYITVKAESAFGMSQQLIT